MREWQQNTRVAWLIAIGGSLLTACVPFLFLMETAGTPLPAVLPQLETDTLYYLAQTKEVLNGHPWLGNPYIKEYADTAFPGLLLPIWIGSIPGIFTDNVTTLFAINTVLWSILTGVALFMLHRQAGTAGNILAAIIAVLGVATMHNNLLRPGIMQTVYPAFALWMLTLLLVLRQPRNSKHLALLGCMTVVSFYLYPFLWMTTFTAYGLLILLTLLRHDTAALKPLLITGIGITAACMPQILNILSLFQDDLARELNMRVGLTETHAVLPLTLLNMKYIIVTTGALLLIAVRRKLSPAEWMVAIAGAALCIGSVSNVITGKQMDFDTHFWRLSLPWAASAIVVLCGSIRNGAKWQRFLAGSCLTLLLMTSVNRAFVRANAFAYLRHRESYAENTQQLQAQSALYSFLKTLPPEQVLLTPGGVSEYVPIYTEHYVLFEPKAGLHTISDTELYTRFLVQNIDTISADFLRANATYVSGFGPRHAAIYANAYGAKTTYLDFSGGDELIANLLTEAEDIDADYSSYLQRFSAGYVITDAAAEHNPRVPDGAETVFDDGRFRVYQL